MTADISMEQLQTAVQRLAIDPVQGVDLAANEIKALQAAVEVDPADNKVWDAACALAEALANAARNESVRTPLGESGIIHCFGTMLKIKNCTTEFQRQTLRVLGNACFDHEDNRKRVENAGIIPVVIKYLENTENSTLVLTTCGFLLNSSMGYEPIQRSIHENGGVQYLTNLLDPARIDEEEHIVTMAVKVLDNVIEDDASRNAFKLEDAERIVNLVKYEYDNSPLEDLDLLDSLATILLHAVAENDDLEIALVDSHCFQTLLDLVERSGWLIEGCMNEEDKQRIKEISRTITKTVVFCTSPDEKMEPLFNDQALVQRFLSWAKSEDENLIQCAVYALGNLARSDSHCTQLVQLHHLEEILLDIFESQENATTQYAVLCCLKHLCLPKGNKSIIGKTGAITKLAPMLDTSKDMLKRNQFLVIGIIKLLCVNEYDNSKQVVMETATNGTVVLNIILSFLGRVDDSAAKSEATRILTNLVKSVWFQSNTADVRQRLVQSDVVLPIAEMVRTSTFIVLKNDGIIALTLIFAEYDDSVKQVLPKIVELGRSDIVTDEKETEQQKQKKEQRAFLEVVADVATANDDSQIPVEIQCNACILLENMARAASGAGNTHDLDMLRESCLKKLESAAKSDSKVSSFAQKAVTVLNA